MAIAYTAGDNYLIFSNERASKRAWCNSCKEEEEISAFQAAYSMGGMTSTASLYESDNIEGVAGRNTKKQNYLYLSRSNIA